MKTKGLVIAVILFVVFLPVFAGADELPELEWAEKLTTKHNNRSPKLAADGTGGVYVAGTNKSGATHTQDQDYVIARYDKDGNLLWRDDFHKDIFEGPSGIGVDSEGNAYVVGWTRRSTSPYGDFIIMKYTPGGSREWVREYEGEGAARITVTADGTVYIVGHRYGWGHDFFIRKYDSDGNVLLSRVYKERNYQSYYDHKIDGDGNIYITGIVSPTSRFVTMKTDPSGDVLWTREYSYVPGKYNQTLYPNLALDATGGVYVSGMTAGRVGWHYVTVKYDGDGNEMWDAAYLRANYTMSGSRPKNEVDSEGNLYMGGSDGSTAIFVKYDSATGTEEWRKGLGFFRQISDIEVDGSDDIYITGPRRGWEINIGAEKYDKDGTRLWRVSYDSEPGRNSYDWPYDLELDGAGNVFITGIGGWAQNYSVLKYRQADVVPPEISISSPAAGDYSISGSITVEFSVTDDDSGVAYYEADVDGTSVDTGITYNLYEFGAGEHTLTVSAEDAAGNTAEESVTFTVTVTADSLVALIGLLYDEGLIKNRGVATALIKKVENGAMGAFLNHLDAQDGKHVDGVAADILRSAASAL